MPNNIPQEYKEQAKQALQRLKMGNEMYCKQDQNPAKWTEEARRSLARDGQTPYAVIVTCSDSRVPPEHLFSAGLGELFVIRTAGHLIDWNTLGSVEYGVTALGAPLVVVLGHTKCGAVGAALTGKGTGAVVQIASQIAAGLRGETDPYTCEVLHTKNSLQQLQEAKSLAPLVQADKLMLLGAMYDVETGAVRFLDEA